jgi:hypothetical protein
LHAIGQRFDPASLHHNFTNEKTTIYKFVPGLRQSAEPAPGVKPRGGWEHSLKTA